MICIMKFNFVDYNHITALALNNMCKNEQVNQIEKNLKELMFLKEELDSFDEKLAYLSEIKGKKVKNT